MVLHFKLGFIVVMLVWVSWFEIIVTKLKPKLSLVGWFDNFQYVPVQFLNV